MGKIQFLMDTGGHCFLCLKVATRNTEGISGMEGNSPKICSFRNICEYLKINVMEVKNEAMPISSYPSYTILEQSELKGVLCEECLPLFEQFTKYFMELEGIQMKLRFSLKSIYDRMVNADSSHGKSLEEFRKEILRRQQTALRSGFVEQLRRKTLSRCSVIIENLHQTNFKPAPADIPAEVVKTQLSANMPVVGEEVVEAAQQINIEALHELFPDTLVKRQCHLCSFSVDFDDDKSLQIHYNRVHGQQNDGKFRCDICDKSFNRNFNLIMHRQSTHFGKKFNCAFCSKSFSQSDLRRRHMQLSCTARISRTSRHYGMTEVQPSEDSITVQESEPGHSEVQSSEETVRLATSIINPAVGRNDIDSSNSCSMEMSLLTEMSPVDSAPEVIMNLSRPIDEQMEDNNAVNNVSVKSEQKKKANYGDRFKCDHCHKTFPLRFKRERHMSTCPKKISKQDSSTDKKSFQVTRKSMRIRGRLEKAINKLEDRKKSPSSKKNVGCISMEDIRDSGKDFMNVVTDVSDVETSSNDVVENKRQARRVSPPSRYSFGASHEFLQKATPNEFCVCKTQMPGNMVRCGNTACQSGTWFHFDNDPPCVQFNNEDDWYCPMCHEKFISTVVNLNQTAIRRGASAS